MVNYSVAADTANGSRVGRLTVAGQTFTVLQGSQAGEWTRQESGTTNNLRAVHFINEGEGWVAGLNATLLKTSNGGASWSGVTNTGVPTAAGFLAVRMVDQGVVWIGGSQAAGRTSNDGASWRGSFWNPGVLPTHNSLFPLSPTEALAVGPGAPVSHILEDNFTITITHTGSPSGLNDIYAIDADNAWAVGAESFEPVAQFDQAQNRFVPVPIDLGPETDQVFLILYGTGFRFRSALSSASVKIGGAEMEVLYAAEAPGFIGLDQSNVRLSRSLIGRGEVDPGAASRTGSEPSFGSDDDSPATASAVRCAKWGARTATGNFRPDRRDNLRQRHGKWSRTYLALAESRWAGRGERAVCLPAHHQGGVRR